MRFWVYILTNWDHKVLYVGVTNNIARRAWEHKQHLVPGFTDTYNVTKLVYAEETIDVMCAIEREKQIKRWRREKKIRLIEELNPNWEEITEF